MSQHPVQYREGPAHRHFGAEPSHFDQAYSPEHTVFVQSPVAPVPEKKLFGLGNFSFQDVKSALDRMGGLDGMVNTMGKVQKIVGSFKEIQPMFRVLWQFLPGRRPQAQAAEQAPARRRRRRRRRGKVSSTRAYTRRKSSAHASKKRRRSNRR